MVKYQVIIGSGFGDEGKGLTTDYLVSECKGTTLNVRFNGGRQAGHTVCVENDRHVFNSLGSGMLRNKYGKSVDMYMSQEFIIEPYNIINELFELERMGVDLEKVSVYVHSNCKLSTIYELTLNKERERLRGENKHGSCGCGIFETITRDRVISFRVSDLYKGKEHINRKLSEIEEYFIEQMKSLGLTLEDITKVIKVNSDEEIAERAKLYYQLKSYIVDIKDENSLFKCYDNIIFEGAQGLMLDMDNIEYMPHLTPSHTGLRNVVDILRDKVTEQDEVEVYYVTRSYLTRHGNGRLDNEVRSRLELGDRVEDLTNEPNEFQGTLRYGKIRLSTLAEAINRDFKISEELHCKCKCNMMITHLDQTDYKIITEDKKLMPEEFIKELKELEVKVDIALTNNSDKLYIGRDKYSGVL